MFHVKQNKKVEKYFPGNNLIIYKNKIYRLLKKMTS